LTATRTVPIKEVIAIAGPITEVSNEGRIAFDSFREWEVAGIETRAIPIEILGWITREITEISFHCIAFNSNAERVWTSW